MSFPMSFPMTPMQIRQHQINQSTEVKHIIFKTINGLLIKNTCDAKYYERTEIQYTVTINSSEIVAIIAENSNSTLEDIWQSDCLPSILKYYSKLGWEVTMDFPCQKITDPKLRAKQKLYFIAVDHGIAGRRAEYLQGMKDKYGFDCS